MMMIPRLGVVLPEDKKRVRRNETSIGLFLMGVAVDWCVRDLLLFQRQGRLYCITDVAFFDYLILPYRNFTNCKLDIYANNTTWQMNHYLVGQCRLCG